MKAAFLLLCVVGIGVACELSAWAPWWTAGPATLVLGASIQWIGTRVHEKLLERQRGYRRDLKPQARPPRSAPSNGRLTYRVKL